MEKEKLFCKGRRMYCKAWRWHFKSCIVESSADQKMRIFLSVMTAKTMLLCIKFFHRWSMTLTLLGKLLLRMH